MSMILSQEYEKSHFGEWFEFFIVFRKFTSFFPNFEIIGDYNENERITYLFIKSILIG